MPPAREDTAGDMSSGTHQLLVDDAVAAYLTWREHAGAVESAYRCWQSAESDEAEFAFAVYCAALDREERASAAYARSLERAAA